MYRACPASPLHCQNMYEYKELTPSAHLRHYFPYCVKCGQFCNRFHEISLSSSVVGYMC